MRAARIAICTLILASCSRAPTQSSPMSPTDGPAGPASSATNPDGGGGEAKVDSVIDVAAGMLHSCALFADGQVACWGSNDHGQLGATADDRCVVEDMLHNVMPPLETPCRAKLVRISGLADVTQLVAAGFTTCARLKSGSVKCWGQNNLGQIGDGTTSDRQTPTEVSGLSHVVQIALSTTHACARLESGDVACWGGNFSGQLGVAPAQPPKEVLAREGRASVKQLDAKTVPKLDHVVEVATGEGLTCARRSDQSVWCFGQPMSSVLGSSAPQPVPELQGATALALGEAAHCALMADGSARCWGSRRVGQIVGGVKDDQKTPAKADQLVAVSQIAWGTSRGCAVTRGRKVSCWGDNGKSQVEGPHEVGLGSKSTRVAVGINHACAVAENGSVWCWGDGFYGATGSRAGSNLPTSAFWTPPRQVVP